MSTSTGAEARRLDESIQRDGREKRAHDRPPYMCGSTFGLSVSLIYMLNLTPVSRCLDY